MNELLNTEHVSVEQADETPKCEWRPLGRCDREQVWSLLSSCGCTRNICREHDAVAMQRQQQNRVLSCSGCDTEPVTLVGRIRI